MGFSEDRVIISLSSTVYKFLARASRVAEVSNRWELLLMSPLWSGFPLTSLPLSHFSWQFWILTSHSLYFCTDAPASWGLFSNCESGHHWHDSWHYWLLPYLSFGTLKLTCFTFTHRSFCTHTHFYTQVLLHTESFYTQSLYIQTTFIYHYWPNATFSQEMKVERQKL